MAVPCPPWRCACRTHQQVPPCSCLSALCRSCEGVILTCVILTCMPTHMHAKADALLELRRRATSLTLQHRVFALALCCQGGMSTLPDVHARARTCDSISLAIESRKEQIECRSRQQEIERGQQAIPHAQPAVGDGSGEGTVGCGRAGGARLYSGVSCVVCRIPTNLCRVWCGVPTKVCRVACRSPPGSLCILAKGSSVLSSSAGQAQAQATNTHASHSLRRRRHQELESVLAAALGAMEARAACGKAHEARPRCATRF
jgi:hypothetical protein